MSLDSEAKIHPLEISYAYMNFMMPFSFHLRDKKELIQNLQRSHFDFFSLKDQSKEDAYYGDQIAVCNEQLDQYFLPYIERKVFPASAKESGFLRFTKKFDSQYTHVVHNSPFTFQVNSVDIVLCPFGIGIITIRTEMKEEEKSIDDVIAFIHHFRVIDPKLDEQKGADILVGESTKYSTNDFIFKTLCPEIQPFVIHDEKLQGYFGSLPFFEDERMLTSAFVITSDEADIEEDHLFRFAHVDGKTNHGKPFMSSTNNDYIERYVQEHVHDRWAPDSYTITSEKAQVTISRKSYNHLKISLGHFFGTHYYNLLLHYFYKVMLLKLSFQYSELRWGKDEDYVEDLIRSISEFSSRYYYREISVWTEGKELSKLYRDIFNIPFLFEEVKETLNDLYRAQENMSDKRMNMLLFMLTIFTVVSGIYGMNLVIQDWEGTIKWGKIPSYSFFEWISLITALGGILLSVVILSTTGIKGLLKQMRKWKRRREY